MVEQVTKSFAPQTGETCTEDLNSKPQIEPFSPETVGDKLRSQAFLDMFLVLV